MASLLALKACRAPSTSPTSTAGSSGGACRRPALVLAGPRGSVDNPSGNARQQRSSSSGGIARRRALLGGAAAVGALLSLQQAARAEGAVPKGYLDTAQKLVDALREAISADLSDAEEREVRRAADPAKSLVREFLTRWRGNPLVAGEESYTQLTSAIQQLGSFYQANGQRARLTPAVGQALLDTLDAAEAALPAREERPLALPFF